MATPLTDAINALTTYANTVTGASDTTLSDAVGTLAAGYGGGGGGSPLPSGYTQLLYLESSGTQYIDTGLYTKANQSYYIKYRCGSGSQNIMGNNLATGCGMFIQVNSQTTYFRFGSANYVTTSYTPYYALGLDLLRDFCVKLDGLYMHDYLPDGYTKFTANGGSSVTEDSSIHNILFGRTTGANAQQLSKVKIYYFKCTEGDTVVREMYPCKRDSDSVLGFYDVANNVFYQNAGTGTFSYGTL